MAKYNIYKDYGSGIAYNYPSETFDEFIETVKGMFKLGIGKFTITKGTQAYQKEFDW